MTTTTTTTPLPRVHNKHMVINAARKGISNMDEQHRASERIWGKEAKKKNHLVLTPQLHDALLFGAHDLCGACDLYTGIDPLEDTSSDPRTRTDLEASHTGQVLLLQLADDVFRDTARIEA